MTRKRLTFPLPLLEPADRDRRPLRALVFGFLAAGTLGEADAQTNVDSSITVPGDQVSPWAINSDLAVGYNATGRLTITNAGQVTSQNAYLGYNVSAVGTIDVTGPNTSLTSTLLAVGNNGDGNVNASDGAKVAATEIPSAETGIRQVCCRSLGQVRR
jgi:T5SS/PEP-CTERM-associated repeat protein